MNILDQLRTSMPVPVDAWMELFDEFGWTVEREFDYFEHDFAKPVFTTVHEGKEFFVYLVPFAYMLFDDEDDLAEGMFKLINKRHENAFIFFKSVQGVLSSIDKKDEFYLYLGRILVENEWHNFFLSEECKSVPEILAQVSKADSNVYPSDPSLMDNNHVILQMFRDTVGREINRMTAEMFPLMDGISSSNS